MSRAYYNEIDPFAAQWLRELIAAGHIAPGDVDTRSIVDVRPDDLRGYTQCHFFAGIGVWSYALRLAGVPDSWPVWTGSCPCQPFSAAGKGGGFADERHLWPALHHLIRECNPDVVLGEQVASKDGLAWLDLVQADMEGSDCAFGAVDTCSAGHGAPHVRQRLRFAAERCIGLADANHSRLEIDRIEQARRQREAVERSRSSGVLEHSDRSGSREGEWDRTASRHWVSAATTSGACGLADSDIGPCEQGSSLDEGRHHRGDAQQGAGSSRSGLSDIGRPGPTNGFWRDADWLFCRDGRWRPVEPGTFPLAHGASARVGRLRGYGNAVDAQATAGFIEAYLDIRTIVGAGGCRDAA